MSADAVNAEFVEEKSTQLAVPQPQAVAPASLFATEDPVEVITKATRVADALKAVIQQKNLISKINDREYPLVEAWQCLGAMLNVAPIIEWTRPIEGGWEARVVVYNREGKPITSAENQCTRREKKWASRDDYAIRSMAQTRTLAKAYRGALGFIMTLAGYEATPAEEIPPADEPPKTAAAAPTDAQQKQIAPRAEQLREMYKECRKVVPSLPENVRDWCAQFVEGYERGKPLTEKMAWFMFNAFSEMLKTPELANAVLPHYIGQEKPGYDPHSGKVRRIDDPPAYRPVTIAHPTPVHEQLAQSLDEPITDGQVTSLQILFRSKGYRTEAARHHFANELIGKPSSRMFNKRDLARVREALEQLPSIPTRAAQ